MSSNQDDWETDPDFVNDITEKESRWGSKTVVGSGVHGAVDMECLRKDTIESDRQKKKLEQHSSTQPAFGYGGKFGVMQDRMDKCAKNWDYKSSSAKHSSQVDYSYGFGGKFGVQNDRRDKSAHDWEHRDKLAVHDSQKNVSVDVKGNVSHDWLISKAAPVAQSTRKPPIVLPTAERNGVVSGTGDAATADDQQQKSAKQNLQEELSICKASSLRDKFEKLAVEQQQKVIVSNNRPAPEKLGPWKKSIDSDVQATVGNESVSDGIAENDDEWNDSDVMLPPPPPLPPQSTTPVSTEAAEIAVVDDEEGDDHPAVQMPTDSVEQLATEAPHPLGEPDHPMADTGVKAIALYDYQAGDVDEISFEPDDVISNIDMVDTDWWRGFCRGRYGLFPANYVELCP